MAQRFRHDIQRGRLSEAEDREVIRLHNRGFVPGRIAQVMNRHPSTINWAMTRLGLKPPAPRTFDYMRNGRPVRSWAPEEDRFIQDLRAQGLSTPKIARQATERFGHPRGAGSVRVRLIQLANLAEHAADAA